jgi:hypothetical protein
MRRGPAGMLARPPSVADQLFEGLFRAPVTQDEWRLSRRLDAGRDPRSQAAGRLAG